MNRDELEKLILLEQSGELDETQLAALETTLASDADAQAYRNALAHITEAVKLPEEALAVSELTTERILEEARIQSSESKAEHPAWLPRLAYAAAALVLAVSAWAVFKSPSGEQIAKDDPTPPPPAVVELAWDDGLDEFDAEIATLDAVMDFTETEWNLSEFDSDVDGIARELMKLEDPSI